MNSLKLIHAANKCDRVSLNIQSYEPGLVHMEKKLESQKKHNLYKLL